MTPNRYILFFGQDLRTMEDVIAHVENEYTFSLHTDVDSARTAIASRIPDLVIVELVMGNRDPIEPVREIIGTDGVTAIAVVGRTEESGIRETINALAPSCVYARYEANEIEQLVRSLT